MCVQECTCTISIHSAYIPLCEETTYGRVGIVRYMYPLLCVFMSSNSYAQVYFRFHVHVYYMLQIESFCVSVLRQCERVDYFSEW